MFGSHQKITCNNFLVPREKSIDQGRGPTQCFREFPNFCPVELLTCKSRTSGASLPCPQSCVVWSVPGTIALFPLPALYSSRNTSSVSAMGVLPRKLKYRQKRLANAVPPGTPSRGERCFDQKYFFVLLHFQITWKLCYVDPRRSCGNCTSNVPVCFFETAKSETGFRQLSKFRRGLL